MGRLRQPTGLAALLALGWALMAGCYLLISPPGSSSDEGAHLVRAVAVAHGDVVGGPPRHPALLRPSTPRGWAWLAQTSRAQRVPPWFDRAPLFECYVEDDLPASCAAAPQAASSPDTARAAGRIDTWVGSYPPYAYAVLGGLTRWVGSPDAALYLGRLTTLGLATLMAFAAVRLIAEVAPGALPWVALGMSSSAVYYFGQLNPSGLEIAAGLLVWAGLVRVRAGPQPQPQVGGGAGAGAVGRAGETAAGDGGASGAALLAVGACVLVLSRELGLVWLALAVLVLPPPVRVMRQAARTRTGRVGAAAVALSCAAALAWSLALAPQPDLTGADLGPPGWGTWGRILHQYAGGFAFSELTVPAVAFALWGVGLLTLLVLTALQRGGRLAVLRALVAAELALWAVQVPTSASGFGPVARYVLPVLLGVFVVGGWCVATASPGPLARRAGQASVLLTVTAHLAGALTVAHRYGQGGPGGHSMLGWLGWSWPGPSWTWAPPGGYPLALGLFGLGLLLVTAGVLAATADRAGHANRAGHADRAGARRGDLGARPGILSVPARRLGR